MNTVDSEHVTQTGSLNKEMNSGSAKIDRVSSVEFMPIPHPRRRNAGWTDFIPARVVLYILSFSGFLVSFMMRTDINLAMVAMVKPVTPSDTCDYRNNSINDIPSTSYYCYTPFVSNDSLTEKKEDDDGEFTWSPIVQSSIISSFYWSYIMSQVVGGVLTHKFGTKIIFGVSQLATALSALCIPLASEWHWGVLVLLRSIQGIASGLTWPAMYALVGHWIPEHERSRFMSSFQGFSFGIGVTYMMAGVIIAHFGWRVLFYVTGSLGLLWCVAWYFFAFDEPEEHPRISPRELQYIQSHVSESVAKSKAMPVPWTAILTSMPAWAIGITTFGRIWVHYTFMIPGPKYIKTVLGLNIQQNGFLSGAPFICSYLSSVLFCWIADKMHTKDWMSLTNIRKMNTALSQVLPGLMVLLIGYLGCDVVSSLIVWFIAVTLITAAYAGAMASIVDIAPNLAGPVLAFAQTIHMSASFIAPLVAGAITNCNESLDQWRIVFGVTAAVACGTYVVFQIYGTADIQDWNYPGGKPPFRSSVSVEVLKPLQNEPVDNI